MEKSQFSQYIAKWFTGILLFLTKTINGKEAEAIYSYKVMLTKKFSASMTWESLSIDGRAVMADVVALDARFPLKKRSSIKRASGTIPKLGTKRSLNETQMNDIMLLEAMPGDYTKEIVSIIFDDTTNVVKGVWERIEYMFLQGLSNNGVYEVTTANNVGTALRVDFEQPDRNKFGVVVAWSDPTAKPIDDIIRVMKAATTYGHSLAFIHMNDATFTELLNNAQVKRYFAVGNGAGSLPDNALTVPLPEQFKAFMKAQYKLTINVIDRAVIFERDGVDTVFQCWTDNKVVFTPTMNVGNLVHSKLAAEMRPNKAVSYGKVDDYILVSIYQKMDDTPLELTTSQARVLPVINMHNIYTIDTEEAQDSSDASQTEGDEFINIYGDTAVLRVNLINALNALGVKVNASMKDTTLVKKVNELSDADEETLKIALEVPIVSAGADSTTNVASKTITGTATAASGKSIASTQWTLVSGPNTPTIVSPAQLSTNVTGLITGTYVFKLTAIDSAGTQASDTVSIAATVA